MSKSGGGGGLKGHDKGGGGGRVKVVAKDSGLEAALDKVPDAFLCPAGHRMKLHGGSRREGPLTCDGPDDVCCGKDGDGVLYPGEPRYSCVECDFDICEGCCEAETAPELTPEEAKEAARQRLREKLGRGSGRRKEQPQPPEVPEVVKEPAAAKQLDAADKEADTELRSAIESSDIAALKDRLNALRERASAEVIAEAKRAIEKAKARAKKAAQKQRRAAGATASGTEEAAEPSDATEVAAEPSDGTEVVAPTAEGVPSPSNPATFKFSTAAAPASPATAATATFKFTTAVADMSPAPPPTTPPPTTPLPAVKFEFAPSFETPPKKPPILASAAPAELDGPVAGQGAKDGLEALLPVPANPLLCPFTGEIFVDPVFTADGATYERSKISEYLETHENSPLTGKRLAHKSLVPNLMAFDLVRKALAF